MTHLMKRVACGIGLVLPLWLPAADPRLRLELAPDNGLELLWVEPGSFSMGSPLTEASRGEDEPARPVTLKDGFYLGRTEVTVRQFEQFVRETRYRTEAEDGRSGGYGWDGTKLVQSPQYTWRNPGYVQTPEHPVTLVTWVDARKFCDWLAAKSRRPVGLPTEAQWEYACRAGEAGPWPGGEADRVGWSLSNAGGHAHPVGTLATNAWGFADLSGNVWEWCQDWYGPYDGLAAADPIRSDPFPGEKARRVLRGGSWLKEPRWTRSAARFRNDPRSRNPDNGFRVAILSIAPTPTPLAPPPAPSASGIPEPPKAASVSPALAPPPPSSPPPAPRGVEYSPRSSRRVSQGLGSFFWVGVAVVGLVLVLVLQTVRRALSGEPAISRAEPLLPPGSSAPDPGALIKIFPSSDGFWIRSRLPQGTRLAWSCLAGGKPTEGIVDFIPGPQGQFIFTSLRPTEIKVRTLGSAELAPGFAPPGAPASGAMDLGTAAGMVYGLSELHRPPPLPNPDDPGPRGRLRGRPSAY